MQFSFLLGFYFLPGGYILRGIHPSRSIYLTILIYLTFIKTLLLVLKDYSPGFVFRGFVIFFGALFLIFAGFFMPGDYNHIHSDEYRIGAEKLEIVPEKFTVVTES